MDQDTHVNTDRSSCNGKHNSYKLDAENSDKSLIANDFKKGRDSYTVKPCDAGFLKNSRVVTAVLVLVLISMQVQWLVVYIKLTAIKSEQSKNSDLCVPCSTFHVPPSFNDFILGKFVQKQNKKGELMCCATKEELDYFMSLYLKNKLQDEISTGRVCTCQVHKTTVANRSSFRRYMIPIAHIIGSDQWTDNRRPKTASFNVSVKRWYATGRGTILRNIDYDVGQLVIKISGWYFVYSQIYFSKEDNPSSSVFHYVFRYNPKYNGEDMLLQNAMSPSKECDTARLNVVWEYTSYIGGAVELKAGDRLFVKVSKLELMARIPQASNFGVFMIDHKM